MQAALANKLHDEPSFAVYASKHADNAVYLEIRNVGSMPAYLVGISRVICGGVPLPPEEWTRHIESPRHACLTPSSGATLAIVDGDFYDKHLGRGGCILEVSYVNRYGEWRSLMVSFYEHTPVIAMPVRRPPGFLLSLADYVMMLKALITLHKLKPPTRVA